MTNAEQQPGRPKPPPLPQTTADLLALRKGKGRRTLNDQVEDIHVALWGADDRYAEYLDAVWDEQAVEGSLAADNIKAAEMIRDRARAIDDTGEVARQKLATIAKALGVVLRRYGITRKERRNMVGGEVVPGDSGD